MMNTVPTAPRHRTPTWLWVAITLAALALLIVLSVFGWLSEYGDTPTRLVVDGTEYGVFDPSTLSVGEKLGVAFGVMLALVVAAIVVPVALVIALVVAMIGVLIALVVGVGVPLLVVLVVVVLALSPLLLPIALIVWLSRKSRATPAPAGVPFH